MTQLDSTQDFGILTNAYVTYEGKKYAFEDNHRIVDSRTTNSTGYTFYYPDSTGVSKEELSIAEYIKRAMEKHLPSTESKKQCATKILREALNTYLDTVSVTPEEAHHIEGLIEALNKKSIKLD